MAGGNLYRERDKAGAKMRFGIVLVDAREYIIRCDNYKEANVRANELVDEANAEDERNHFEVDIVIGIRSEEKLREY